MPNPAAVQLIAQALPALTHPGDGRPVTIPLPMFRSSGIPADQAEQFAQDAGLPHADVTTLVAEAIVHLLETNGLAPTPAGQLDELQRAATAVEHLAHRDVKIICRCCGTELFTATFSDFATDKATVRPEVITAMRALNAECALAHQAH